LQINTDFKENDLAITHLSKWTYLLKTHLRATGWQTWVTFGRHRGFTSTSWITPQHMEEDQLFIKFSLFWTVVKLPALFRKKALTRPDEHFVQIGNFQHLALLWQKSLWIISLNLTKSEQIHQDNYRDCLDPNPYPASQRVLRF